MTHGELTPNPFIKKHTRFRTSPGVPSTYRTKRPERSIDAGTRTRAPGMPARRRSSGYQKPRLAFHFATMPSESLPASGAPTIRKGEDQGEDDEGKKLDGARGRTHAPDTAWNETGADKRFVLDSVAVTLHDDLSRASTPSWNCLTIESAIGTIRTGYVSLPIPGANDNSATYYNSLSSSARSE